MSPAVKRKVSGMGTRVVEGMKKNLYVVEVPKRKKRINKRKRELKEVADKSGRRVRRWVNPDFHYTAPVKYGGEFAEGRAMELQKEPQAVPEKKLEDDRELDKYLTRKGDEPRFKQPTIDKFDRRMRERLAKAKDLKEYKKMQKEFARVIKSKVYQKVKETGAKTYSTTMKAMDDKSQVEAFAKKKSKSGVSIKLGEVDLKGAFQMMVILIVIILVLSFLSWLSSLF